jgi:N utilization substance protein B
MPIRKDIMTRREIRENVFKILFSLEYNDIEAMREQAEIYLDNLEEEVSGKDKLIIADRVADVSAHKDELDEIISGISAGWKLGRIGKAELAILRLAVYEIKFDEDIPVKVAINEAVELSKKYCDVEAKSFVNALLAKLA